MSALKELECSARPPARTLITFWESEISFGEGNGSRQPELTLNNLTNSYVSLVKALRRFICHARLHKPLMATTSSFAQQLRTPRFTQSLRRITRPSPSTNASRTFTPNRFFTQSTLARPTIQQRLSESYKSILRSNVRSNIRSQRFNSTKPDVTPNLGSPGTNAKPGLSERLKALSREYGWSALGVYLALSALDFPFCFLAVRLLGTDRIAKAEHVIIEWFSNLVRTVYPDFRMKKHVGGAAEGVESDLREGETEKAKGTGDNASLGTQLVLAYAVHKSLIIFRVPLTAAVLPKIVKTLRGWGYNIGKKAAPAAKA